MLRHPGKTLRDEFMEPLGLNANRLASGLGVNRSTVGRLLAGTHGISPALAARLGAYFGVPARWWLLMQAEYDASIVSSDTSRAEGVKPLVIPADVLLTPTGAMKLRTGRQAGSRATQPASLEMDDPSRGGPVATAGWRQVREVRFDNGAVGLVGESP